MGRCKPEARDLDPLAVSFDYEPRSLPVPPLGRCDRMEKLLCPKCLKVVAPSVIEREETLPVRGEDVTVLAKVAVCPACGEDIGTDTLDDATFTAVYFVKHK